jgi:hypothetical protein
VSLDRVPEPCKHTDKALTELGCGPIDIDTLRVAGALGGRRVARVSAVSASDMPIAESDGVSRAAVRQTDSGVWGV